MATQNKTPLINFRLISARIKKHYNCASVTTKDGLIVIRTNPLFFKKYDIGNYIITIRTQEAKNYSGYTEEDIIIKHVQNNQIIEKDQYCSHPFIQSTWTCFGTGRPLLAQLFQNLDFYQIYLLTVHLLTSEPHKGHDITRSWNRFLTAYGYKVPIKKKKTKNIIIENFNR